MSEESILLLAAIVTIIGYIAKFTKWGRKQSKKIWHFLTRYRTKVPRETIRIVPQHYENRWSLGTSKGKPAVNLISYWYITNISDVDVLLCGVSLKKPKTVGHIIVHNGNWIPTGFTTEATAHFSIQPEVCKKDATLLVDIDFMDQFGNIHRVRKVKFQPPPKKKEEPIAAQMEIVSDITDPVEREIVGVLQAEINRYKDCGRGVGGLGSIQTTYLGRSYCGVGSDCRETGSPKLQAVVSNPVDAKIESDNATIMIKFYYSLNSDQQRALFLESMLKRLSRETLYAPIGYFVLFIFYRIGYLKEVLDVAKEKLQGDSAYGFSDFLMLLDGLLKYEYPSFSNEMLDNVEQFLKGIKDHTFRISERLSTARSILLSKRVEDRNK